MPSPLRHPLLVLLVLAALLAVAVPLGFGFLGRLHPAFDSFTHFRLHLAIALVGAALAAMVVGQRAAGALALAFAAAAFATIWSAQWSSHRNAASAAAGAAPPAYTLLQLNLRYDNPDHAAVLSLIARRRPDIITLNEVSQAWAEALERIREAYPHRIICPFPNGRWGSAILSRRPFAEGIEPMCLDRGAMAVAAIDLGGRHLDAAALHLSWPWPFEQAWQLRNLSPRLAELHGPALLAGDLNATPWSATVGKVMEAGGLHRVGPAGMTWLHRRLPRWLLPLGLAIDHVFAKGEVQVLSVETLEDVGSDHLPVLATFDLPIPTLPEDADEKQVVLDEAGPSQARAISRAGR